MKTADKIMHHIFIIIACIGVAGLIRHDIQMIYFSACYSFLYAIYAGVLCIKNGLSE